MKKDIGGFNSHTLPPGLLPITFYAMAFIDVPAWVWVVILIREFHMNRLVSASLTMMLVASMVTAGDLKSGPQPGKGVSSFYPLNIFNADSPSRNGKENCLV